MPPPIQHIPALDSLNYPYRLLTSYYCGSSSDASTILYCKTLNMRRGRHRWIESHSPRWIPVRIEPWSLGWHKTQNGETEDEEHHLSSVDHLPMGEHPCKESYVWNSWSGLCGSSSYGCGCVTCKYLFYLFPPSPLVTASAWLCNLQFTVVTISKYVNFE